MSSSIEKVNPTQGASRANSDAPHLFLSLNYVVLLLETAASYRQNAIVTQAKLVNSDIEVGKELNRRALAIGDVVIPEPINNLWHEWHVRYRYYTGFEHPCTHWGTQNMCLSQDQVPHNGNIIVHGEVASVDNVSYSAKRSWNVCANATAFHDAIGKADNLQKARDLLQDKYTNANQAAEQNSSTISALTTSHTGFINVCGLIFDILTKMTNTLVIPA